MRRIPLASFSFGITTLLAAERAQERVGEADVLDDAVLVLEEHPVADAQRLRDREHHARDEVGERLARREAEDRGGDRARGQQRGGEPVDAVELRDSAIATPTRMITALRQPADEAQARAGLGRELAAR